MKKYALKYGSIAGAIVIVGWFLGNLVMKGDDGIMDFSKGELLGYATMLIALSSIFFGVRKYKMEQLGGKMSFKQGFLSGLSIGAVCSLIYVVGWMIYYPNFAPDFMEQYSAYQDQQWIDAGVVGDALEAKRAEWTEMMSLYENPVMMFLFTLMEIFPIAIVISLICGLTLKSKKSELNPA